MYERGLGCVVDIKKAMQYYHMAADQGNTFSQYYLGNLVV